MGTLTGDLLRILAHGGINTLTHALGEVISAPIRERSEMRKKYANTLFDSLSTLPQEALPEASRKLEQLMGRKGALPSYMAETGNVIGPGGESLAMTPVLGAPVTPEMKQRFIVPAPNKEAMFTNILRGMPKSVQQQAALASVSPKLVAGAPTLGEEAQWLESTKLYGPDGLKDKELGLKDREIAQRKAIADQEYELNKKRIGVDIEKNTIAKDHYKALEGFEQLKILAEARAANAKNEIDRKKAAADMAKAAQDIGTLFTNTYATREVPKELIPGYVKLQQDLITGSQRLMQEQAPKTAGPITTSTFPREVYLKGQPVIVNNQAELDAVKAKAGQ